MKSQDPDFLFSQLVSLKGPTEKNDSPDRKKIVTIEYFDNSLSG